MIGNTEIPEGFKMTEIGPLPEEWETVKLEDLAKKMKAGGTPSRKEKKYWNGEIPFVLIEDMTSCGIYLSKTKETITRDGLENSSAWIIPPYSLLLSMYASIGKTAINTIPLSTNQAILAIIPKSNFDIVFGAYMIRLHANRLIMQNVQSTQKNVNKGIVEKFEIPLPPLSEQKKIAFFLSTIQQAIEKTEAVINATKELKKSMMKHLFTYGPVSVEEAEDVVLKETEVGLVPEEWKVVRLGDVIAEGPQNGIYKPQLSYGKGTPIVRIDDYDNEGDIITYASNRVQLSAKEIEKYRLNSNDILINRVNSLSHLGKVALVGHLSESTVFESNMMRFSVSGLTTPEYLFRFLTYFKTREQMRGKAKRAVAQSSINQGDIKSLFVLLPSLSIQQKIANTLSAIDQKIETEQIKKKALEELFKTLLHNLMTGRIRVNHLEVPHD